MDMIARIKKEGTDSSKVMDIAHHLTDVSGPRLTNSPGFVRAANWAKDELTSWGLVNAQLEPWGEFGKGWQQEKCYVALLSTPDRNTKSVDEWHREKIIKRRNSTGKSTGYSGNDSICGQAER